MNKRNYSKVQKFFFIHYTKIYSEPKHKAKRCFVAKNLPSRTSKRIFAESLIYLALHIKGVYQLKKKAKKSYISFSLRNALTV